MCLSFHKTAIQRAGAGHQTSADARDVINPHQSANQKNKSNTTHTQIHFDYMSLLVYTRVLRDKRHTIYLERSWEPRLFTRASRIISFDRTPSRKRIYVCYVCYTLYTCTHTHTRQWTAHLIESLNHSIYIDDTRSLNAHLRSV